MYRDAPKICFSLFNSNNEHVKIEVILTSFNGVNNIGLTNYVATRVFTKILCTDSKQIVEESQKYFDFMPVSHRIDIRTARFLDRFSTSENSLCNVFHDQARIHMSEFSVKFDITKGSSWHILLV